MVGDGDGAALRSLILPDGNVLPEGRRACNGWLVDLLMLPDVVGGPVAL